MAAANAEGSQADDAQRKERVKARWWILRQALLGSSSGSGGDGAPTSAATGRFHERSMNAFQGFRVLDRTILPDEDREASSIDASHASEGEWDLVRYSYASPDGRAVQFAARETKVRQRQSSAKRRAEALLSHRKYGVDNTGNVRVWDAEGTLAGFLLSVVLDGADESMPNNTEQEQSTKFSQLRKAVFSRMTNASAEDADGENTYCNLLELGAGQAGLAGLALQAASQTDRAATMKPLRVVLTDGHPSCVENNVACAKMIPKIGDNTTAAIDAQLLLWDSSANGAEACRLINKMTGCETDAGSYQICLASDCVHFQEFHDGLLTTIARTLAVGGIALLCQPSRGSSLDNFMALVDAVNGAQTGDGGAKCPLFQMALFEDFHPKVSAMHSSFIAEQNNEQEPSETQSQYEPNWHRPLLLALQMLRSYDEDVDGEAARQHVKSRKQ